MTELVRTAFARSPVPQIPDARGTSRAPRPTQRSFAASARSCPRHSSPRLQASDSRETPSFTVEQDIASDSILPREPALVVGRPADRPLRGSQHDVSLLPWTPIARHKPASVGPTDSTLK
jgi:hypothetical protein